jgi:hypothetical protein
VPDPGQLTEPQQKWFAAVRAGLERETGRSVAAWAEIARACPETAHRKRLAWMKAGHGLGQNFASLVLNEAFPPETSWNTPDALADTLWVDPQARAIFEAVRARAEKLPDIVIGQRRGFTAFSRNVQFAAIRAAKTGAVLGFALPPDPAAGLLAPRRESWSGRLKSCVALAAMSDVDARIGRWLRAAWENS